MANLAALARPLTALQGVLFSLSGIDSVKRHLRHLGRG